MIIFYCHSYIYITTTKRNLDFIKLEKFKTSKMNKQANFPYFLFGI